jgi:glycosyltransferase A (GT-A) superfamily protein (DUF2064 family)
VAGLGAPADPSLEAALGAEGAARLRAELGARARRWAAAAAPGRAWEATSVDAAAAALAAHAHHGPVLLAAPDVPALDAALVADVLDDVADGVLVAVGASHDGSPYLIGLARPDPELLALATGGFADLVTALGAREGALGLLRSERRLASAADARAAALDPLTPPALAEVLAPLASPIPRAGPDAR